MSSTDFEPQALDEMITRLKEARVMVTQDAYVHLVTDYYGSIENAEAKASLRFLKHRHKDGQPLPRLDTMEEHLKACGAERLSSNWWRFPAGKEVSGE